MGELTVSTVKPWYRSKTLWFNAVVAGLLVLEANFAVLQPYLAGSVYAWFSTVLAVGNAMLRVVTTASLAMGGRDA
ncbi:MAG: hypothetical protein PXX73_04640 [Sideroxydans sp.]|nr:hypothetical protein [Sideroxydans sp.]